MKFWLGVLFFIVCVSLGITFYNKKAYSTADGFSIQKIQFDFPYQKEWEISSLSKEKQAQINSILAQRFTYLGKGARSFSFSSEDGQYVLKFFKYRYHKPHWAVRFLPSVFPFEYYRQRKMKKVSLNTVLNGYKIAYEHDPQSTGLLYIHLNPTVNQHATVEVIDKQGKSHLVDLDHTRFIVQRKVQEATELLKGLLDRGNITLAKQRICQIFDLYISHYQKGIHDLGMGILRNNGFLEDAPIHFDVGKMTLDDKICHPNYHREKTIKMARKVGEWLLDYYPQYHDKIIFELECHLSNIYKEKISLL